MAEMAGESDDVDYLADVFTSTTEQLHFREFVAGIGELKKDQEGLIDGLHRVLKKTSDGDLKDQLKSFEKIINQMGKRIDSLNACVEQHSTRIESTDEKTQRNAKQITVMNETQKKLQLATKRSVKVQNSMDETLSAMQEKQKNFELTTEALEREVQKVKRSMDETDKKVKENSVSITVLQSNQDAHEERLVGKVIDRLVQGYTKSYKNDNDDGGHSV